MFNLFRPRKPQDDSTDILTRLQDVVNAVGRLEQGVEITDFAGNGFTAETVNLLNKITAESITNNGLKNGRISFLLKLREAQKIAVQQDVFLILDRTITGQLRAGTGFVEGDNLDGIHGEHQDMQADITEADMKKRSDGNNNVHIRVEKQPWYSGDQNAVVDRNGKPVSTFQIVMRRAVAMFKAVFKLGKPMSTSQVVIDMATAKFRAAAAKESVRLKKSA